ncbi:outer membrane protein assembly factor BamB [Chitinilyticum piscinae]|uniref:Outer membrane protein assembly factor BamB n=1 Tax=Chitinilyticum piscinae TaxID=2866724 RepID=A0A8J7G1C4_9NEIS|nr:outer membrane protein assembly factor BamB [Chitinilyticum piscinae]MBE9609593.1 outer membrane protein assembly factor BamB [Chitinilyticum piscinae]
MSTKRLGLASCLILALAACGTTSNAPEPNPLPQVADKAGAAVRWNRSIGGSTELRYRPAVSDEAIAVAGAPNQLALLDKASGQARWTVTLERPVAGGVGLNDKLVVVGTLKGDVIAFSRSGQQLWTAKATSEIIAPPVIGSGVVLVRSGDGRVSAFSAEDGSLKWFYQRQQPALLLRNFAAPLINNGVAYVGLPAGRLVALDLQDGRVRWDAPLALPRGASELERVTDVVTTPVFASGSVCAVAYQGRVGCIEAASGTLLWTREASSASGLEADGQAVYFTDDKGAVVALDRSSGRNLWRQDKLANRALSAPALHGNYLLVGDFEGYLHWINRDDGAFVAQRPTDGGRVAVAPQALSGDTVLVQTTKGGLYAFGVK